MQEQRTFSVADLTQCDKEPIQIPGSIQPYGVLLALREPDFTIVQVSTTTQAMLGIPPESLLHAPLTRLLDADQFACFQKALAQASLEKNPLCLFTMQIKGQERSFDGIAHRIDGLLILELEATTTPGQVLQQQPDTFEIYRSIQSAFTMLHQASTVSSYSQMIAQQVRHLTGFDRVMVYRFEDDGHGVVIAEDKREDLEPYLHLHYPASDIPVQARRLYKLNWLRLIADIDYRPATIIPALNPLTGQMLDMSYSVLRSVSPIHVTYLRNMGVQASMSISIVRDNELWGLIACHHTTSRLVPYGIRSACEILGRTMSLQLPTIEAQEEANAIAQMQHIRGQLIEFFSCEEDLGQSLTAHTPTILDLIPATGVALHIGDDITILGETPSRAAIKSILDWIRTQPECDIFATNALAHHYPEAIQWREEASGILALTLSKTWQRAIIWFRAEVIRSIEWAGNPDKPVEVIDQEIHLSPRASFACWKQLVEGTSPRWKHTEEVVAKDFRNALLRVVIHRAEELARLNTELEQSNAQLDIFADIASHDLKEPLRGIHNYAHFLIEDYPQGSTLDEEGIAKLQTLILLTQRMEDLINSLLHYSRLGCTNLILEMNDPNEIVHQTLEMLHLRLEETHTQVLIPRPLPIIACDRVSIGEIFYNLLSNAMKYNDKVYKRVEIGVLPLLAGHVEQIFYVSDNGIGIPQEYHEIIFRMFKRLHARSEYGGGTGVGLTIVKKIIERHGGTIWLESAEGQGTTFYFTLQQKVGEHEPAAG
ncbi:histidine kinase [Dictyobacter alpinus]|uniref:histidine kinase n=1 Tax=Dictyobacter alpinus TaxID=2014873 RepID=A0A402BBE7_9CHLR|nr:ATP-binding protein [Dictyobacter alpinus]GCE28664.1 histidine kinase [Dictyobacter alpinus]